MIRYIKGEEFTVTQFGKTIPLIGPLTDKPQGINIQIGGNGDIDVVVAASIDNKSWHEIVSTKIEIPYSAPNGVGECECGGTWIGLTDELLFFRWYRVTVAVSAESGENAYKDGLGKSKNIIAFISGLIL